MQKSLRTYDSVGRDVLGYLPPKLVIGQRWQIVYYCFDPDVGKLVRKRVSVPFIKSKLERKAYANCMIIALNDKLSKGWNPCIALTNPKSYTLFDDVCQEYKRYLFKMEGNSLLREKSANGYRSFLKTLMEWNDHRKKPVEYVYQFKDTVVDEFLDYIWIDLGRSARTRDNYLRWIGTFSTWMLGKRYIDEDPTAHLSTVVAHKKYEKNRTVIPAERMQELRVHLEKTDRHFLLACEILYYCLIRPNEMSYIRLNDINIKQGTICVYGEVSKNGKSAVVTLPDVVIHRMLDLDIFSHPGDWFLFSRDFRPGTEHRLPKYFCDAWTKVRTALKWPAQYKFYSLKDTGITDLIKEKTDLLAVRDQARHSSLRMTDLYTPLESRSANEVIRHRKGSF